MKYKYDIALPYTAVYIILRREGKIAFVLRQNTDWMNGYWGLIAGKVEKGENFKIAAVREAKEESGITVSSEELKFIMLAHRYTDSDNLTWVDVFFEATSWQGEPYNAEPKVHKELAWMDPKDLPENVIPAVKTYVEAIEARKSYIEYGWPKA